MTPTVHSDATTVRFRTRTEGASASSPNIAAKSQDASLFLSAMMSQMEEDFRKSGDSIRNRMTEIGSKIDGLEQNIFGLVEDAGLDEEEDPNNDEDNLNNSKGSAGVDSTSSSPSPQKPPSSSSPSHTV